MKILQRLKELSSKGIFSYTHTVNSWLSKPGVAVDSDEKRKALKELFSNSRVALVYGAAGTGNLLLLIISHAFLVIKIKFT